MADWGPWLGVAEEKQRMCAVVKCEEKGSYQVCLYDGRYHHHGCIHYDCDRAKRTKHGLKFRKGWGLICDRHYAVLLSAIQRVEGVNADPRKGRG